MSAAWSHAGSPAASARRLEPAARSLIDVPELDPDEALAELRTGHPVLLRHDDGLMLVASAALATPPFVEYLERMGGAPIELAATFERPTRSVEASELRSGGTAARRAYAVQRALHGVEPAPADRGAIAVRQAAPDGVLECPGPTEGAVDLVRLAGVGAAAIVIDVAAVVGTAARLVAGELGSVSVGELVRWRIMHERPVQRVVDISLPTVHGTFEAVGYRALGGTTEFVALVHGEVTGRPDVPVSVHEGCLLGDAMGACPCGCGETLAAALDHLARRPCGILIRLEATESSFFHARRARPAPGRVALAAQVLADLTPASVHVVDTVEPLRTMLIAHGGRPAR